MKDEAPDMLEPAQLEQLLGRLEQRTLQEQDFERLIKMARGLQVLHNLYHRSRRATEKILKMLFGSPTERTHTITGKSGSPKPEAEAPGKSDPPPETTKKRKGHGRRAASQYTGATLKVIAHPQLKAGMECPHGCGGHLHDTQRPAINLHFKAQPLIDAICCQQQRLRCSDCGATHTAPLPAEYARKYDESVGVTLGVARYGFGLPMNRMMAMQSMYGIPMPLGTQYEQIEACYADVAAPLLAELVRQAAQGTVLHNDDTPGKVLDLKREIARAAALSPDEKLRTGIFTTGIVSTLEGRTIVLYATGNKHAGENLHDLLVNRPQEMQPPIQMCDALSRNHPGLNTEQANCNAHARREFVSLADTYRSECTFVLETYRGVYINDTHARTAGLSPEERLRYHQQHSLGPMNAMKGWLEKLLADKTVEPNSDLGGAIKYVIKYWDRLTLFLRKAGTPIDNNICERILKAAIRHRNNSLFYKTVNGAKIGDFFMSVIQTCLLCGANPIHYLTTLRRRICELIAHPAAWMPWNYQANLTAPP